MLSQTLKLQENVKSFIAKNKQKVEKRLSIQPEHSLSTQTTHCFDVNKQSKY